MIRTLNILIEAYLLIGLLMLGACKPQVATDQESDNNLDSDTQVKNHKLIISEDGLRIERADGSDWFWIGDTGWSLFQELDREDAERYFTTRAAQGFTVIQAVAVMGWNREWNEPNVYDERPFHDGNASKPNEEYWNHVDWLIMKAQEYGLYIALLPAWGSYWGNEATLEYAEWITDRYDDFTNLIWVNGGDRFVAEDSLLFNQLGAIYHRDTDALTTFHPIGGRASSTHFHQEQWLDFNMQQSGHGRRDIRADKQVDDDLALHPTKPTLNGEPNYEDHCVNWDPNCAKGIFNAHDVRQLAYWTVFAGATGYTYGHVHVWDFDQGGNKEDGFQDWRVQILDSGAIQMGYLSELMLSRPQHDRKAAQQIIAESSPGGVLQRAVSGEGYAFIYSAQGHPIQVDLDQLPWQSKSAWWLNPRNGKCLVVSDLPDEGVYVADPPGDPDNDQDWVMVIDEKTKNYPPPGKL